MFLKMEQKRTEGEERSQRAEGVREKEAGKREIRKIEEKQGEKHLPVDTAPHRG